MQTREHLLAVVEPTLQGEAPLAIANELVGRGGKATLLLVVTDRVRDEFRRFADAENISAGHAEAVAIDRLTDSYTSRVGGDTATIATIVTASAPSSRAVLGAATASRATSIAIPHDLASRGELRKLVTGSHVPVTVAPRRAA